jgi:hypothetical protein
VSSLFEVVASGRELEPEIAALLDAGQILLDLPLNGWACEGCHASQLIAGHALAHAADAYRCSRPIVLSGDVVAGAVLLRTMQEALLAAWYLGLHPEAVEKWVEGQGPSTDALWLEAYRGIPAMRPYWTLFDEVRTVLNALVHPTPLAMRFASEAASPRSTEAHGRMIRRGAGLALPLSAFAAWTVWSAFSGTRSSHRMNADAYVREALSASRRLRTEKNLLTTD